MGKISDALDKHRSEKLVPINDLREDKAVRLGIEEPEIARARKISAETRLSESLVVLSSPDSADAENFKLLRGQILFPRNREVPRSILVTSAFPGEGKTVIASNLAVSIAMSVDEYVLLIDADMRRARIHRVFGLPNVRGLHEYLIGEKKLEDLIVMTGVDKLSILPAGKSPRNPSELLSSRMMAKFLGEARNRYNDRFIIIDSPPAQIAAEAKFLSKFVDAVIFVVMANKTPSKDAQKAIESLGRNKVMGVVFNGYNHARSSYYKYYDQYYRRE